MRHLRLCLGSLLVIATHSSIAASASDFVISEDGAFVVDIQTELAWSRCIEGMQWNGKTCIGTPRLSTYVEALAIARERTKLDGLQWRVPRVKELQHLLNKKAHEKRKPEELFPATPLGWHWTGSANVDTKSVNQYQYKNIEQGVTAKNSNSLAFLHGWAVNAQTGEARGDVLKREKLLVRLVCEIK
jgi:Protein of unknown function (DUF1566)